MVKYDVPFLSQYVDIGDHQWRARGCGITALAMVIKYWHNQNHSNPLVDLETLLKDGLSSGAYQEGVGWIHAGLVNLAQKYGYQAYAKDNGPKSILPLKSGVAFDLATEELNQRGPVMASVYSGLDINRGGGHIVVITGYSEDLVFFNDPEEANEREGRKVLATTAFQAAYKKRYIMVWPG